MSRDARSMNRTGLSIALAVGVVVGLLFGLFPKLDLRIAELFYDPREPGTWIGVSALARRLREISSWTIALVAAPAVVALAVKLALPNRRLLIPGRAMILIIATLALGPGLLANVFFKDEWG